MKTFAVHCTPKQPVKDALDHRFSTRDAAIPKAGNFKKNPRRELLATAEDVLERLQDKDAVLIGRLGSRIAGADGVVEIPPAPARQEVDPTGAGDAYRAGLVAGLLRGLDVATSGRIASLAATYAIEQVGTAEHSYGQDEFSERFEVAFGSALPAGFFG